MLFLVKIQCQIRCISYSRDLFFDMYLSGTFFTMCFVLSFVYKDLSFCTQFEYVFLIEFIQQHFASDESVSAKSYFQHFHM